MDKRELSKLKKGFKLDNKGSLEVLALATTYCKQEADKMKVIFTDINSFEYLEEELIEKYYTNSKKLLSGGFGAKLFDLNINSSEKGSDIQKFLYTMLDENNFENNIDKLVDKIIGEINYGTDVVITTILAQSFIPRPKKSSKDEEEDDNYHKYILCSINKLESCCKEVNIDTVNKAVSLGNSEVIINMRKPIEGFMFPSITDFRSDVNKVLYCTGSANQVNEKLTQEVLQCENFLTASQEKNIFHSVVKGTVGEEISLKTISDVITTIAEEKINNIEGTISAQKLGDILEAKGIENANDVLTGIVTDMDTMIKIDNIVPNGSKAVKLNNSDITLSVGAGAISKVSQTKKNGKKCLVIELDENVNLDGFKII